MSEERLKEIKDSIEIQYKIAEARNNDHYIIDEELELYNEVIRLREIIDEAVEYIEKHQYKWYDLNGEEYIEPRQFEKDTDASVLLNILKENNNENN